MKNTKVKIIAGCIAVFIVLTVIAVFTLKIRNKETNIINTDSTVESGSITAVSETNSATKETVSNTQAQATAESKSEQANVIAKSEQATEKSTENASSAASDKTEAATEQPAPATEAVAKVEEHNEEVVSEAANYGAVDADTEKIKADIISQLHTFGDYVRTSGGYPRGDKYPDPEYSYVRLYNGYLIGSLFGDDFKNAYEGVFTKEQQTNRMRYAYFNNIQYSLATCTIEYTEVLADYFKDYGPELSSINSIVLSSPLVEGRPSKTFDGFAADLEADIVGYEVDDGLLSFHVYLSSEKSQDGSVIRYRLLDIKPTN